jgi:hypothetical protein
MNEIGLNIEQKEFTFETKRQSTSKITFNIVSQPEKSSKSKKVIVREQVERTAQSIRAITSTERVEMRAE